MKRKTKQQRDEIGLAVDERHLEGWVPQRVLQAAYEAENRITDPAIVAEADRLKALEKSNADLLAALKALDGHWGEYHDDDCPAPHPPKGDCTCGVTDLRNQIDAAIAQTGTEVKPNA